MTVADIRTYRSWHPFRQFIRACWLNKLLRPACLFLAVTGFAPVVEGRPNSHPQAIASWDVRASSLTLQSTSAISGSDKYRALSAGASFTSSSGRLSAQFSAHYLRFRQGDSDAPQATGASLGAALLLHLPFGSAPAEQNGSQTALNLYLGAMPTALVGIERNYLSAPLLVGAGLSFTPFPALSLTPWGQLSRSIDMDPSLRSVSTEEAIEAAQDGELTRAEVEALVEEGLGLETERNTVARFGLSASFHLSRRVNWDFHLVRGTGGNSALGFGTGLVVLWDEFADRAPAAQVEQSAPSQQAAPAPQSTPEVPAKPLQNRPRRRRRGPAFRQVPNSAFPSSPTKGLAHVSLPERQYSPSQGRVSASQDSPSAAALHP